MSKKIIVGMSGGVDSSVTAYLLQKQGWDVTGVFMINWKDSLAEPMYRNTQHGCTWEQDMTDVRAVCDQLNIPFLTFNFVEEYHQRVFDLFLHELQHGRTPNSDITCNQEIKFRLFLEKALQLPNVDAVATGHYARITQGTLCRPTDREKDQTYFLYRIPSEHLNNIQFPLADLTKKEVRSIATKAQLATAEKKDSMGICFIGDINYNAFIRQHLGTAPGDICSTDGTVLGHHDGIHFFTIGQRHGLNIGGKGPYFVVSKNPATSVVTVTDDPNDPQLWNKTCLITDLHWLTSKELPETVDVQVRYRQHAQRARITHTSDTIIKLTFDEPQRAITPGQSAVLYHNDCVLGGGIITNV